MKLKSKILTVIMIIIMIMTVVLLVACNDSNYLIKPTNKKYAETNKRFQNGYGTYNNGVAKSGPEMDRLTSVVPSEKQLDYLELEYYNFIHYGMNTYTDSEWGTGKESPQLFNPSSTKIDTDQWCEVLKASGSKGIIVTAKHHDGFALWQTDTTEHSIKNSPYQNGKGDLVKELSESCAKYGLKMGVYLSPWDMNTKHYGHSAKCNHEDENGGKLDYNEFFVSQLRELLDGRYGDIFSVWFDGARGDDAVIDSNFEYDYEKYYEVVKELQPNAVTCVSGEDVRWVGNEAGVARESEWSVISRGKEASQDFQNNADKGEKLKAVKYDDSDVGSRELLSKYKDLKFFPAEVDVSIRNGWFYHEDQSPKELDHLLKIYYKSVGGNSSLLLNVPPNKAGRIDDKDSARLKEFGAAVNKSTENKMTPTSVKIGDSYHRYSDNGLLNMLSDERNTSYTFRSDEYILDISFETAFRLTRFDIREDLRYSQRVEYFDIYAKAGGKWQLLTEATNVGNRRTLMFDAKSMPVSDTYRIVIKQARKNPVIRSIQFFA